MDNSIRGSQHDQLDDRLRGFKISYLFIMVLNHSLISFSLVIIKTKLKYLFALAVEILKTVQVTQT